MRPRFEKDLSNFNTIAKAEREQETESEDVERLGSVLDWHLDQAAERQGTSRGIQEAVYRIQKKKQEIMVRLKDEFHRLDEEGFEMEKKEGMREAQYDAEKEVFIYHDDRGKEGAATFTEVMTDVDWGVTYALSKETPRNLLKKYFFTLAKHELKGLLDEQIILNELGGNSIDAFKEAAYRGYADDKDAGILMKREGTVAETMVKNILRKIALDTDADFKIHDSDIYQDVEQKIDFIIHRTDKSRGVEVTADEKRQDIGIQFTINSDAIGRKRDQLKRAKAHMTPEWDIDDLVLVFYPLATARGLMRAWQTTGRPAGGPDKLMERPEAERLFRGLMERAMPPEDIDNAWGEFKDYFADHYSHLKKAA